MAVAVGWTMTRARPDREAVVGIVSGSMGQPRIDDKPALRAVFGGAWLR
jgi:hypothetical protein